MSSKSASLSEEDHEEHLDEAHAKNPVQTTRYGPCAPIRGEPHPSAPLFNLMLIPKPSHSASSLPPKIWIVHVRHTVASDFHILLGIDRGESKWYELRTMTGATQRHHAASSKMSRGIDSFEFTGRNQNPVTHSFMWGKGTYMYRSGLVYTLTPFDVTYQVLGALSDFSTHAMHVGTSESILNPFRDSKEILERVYKVYYEGFGAQTMGTDSQICSAHEQIRKLVRDGVAFHVALDQLCERRSIPEEPDVGYYRLDPEKVLGWIQYKVHAITQVLQYQSGEGENTTPRTPTQSLVGKWRGEVSDILQVHGEKDTSGDSVLRSMAMSLLIHYLSPKWIQAACVHQSLVYDTVMHCCGAAKVASVVKPPVGNPHASHFERRDLSQCGIGGSADPGTHHKPVGRKATNISGEGKSKRPRGVQDVRSFFQKKSTPS